MKSIVCTERQELEIVLGTAFLVNRYRRLFILIPSCATASSKMGQCTFACFKFDAANRPKDV